MATLKNIIFDLGAVLLDIDYDKTAQSFHRLGYTNFEEMYSKFKGNNLFNNLETGRVSTQSFLKQMVDAGNGKVTEADIRNAWNSMLLDFRESSFQFLLQLSGSYRVYLLSNTNAIHQAAFEKKFESQMGGKPFKNYFTHAYFSHEVGFRKPDEEIFAFVLANAGIKAGESLFIDDLPANTGVAKKLGFKVHTLLPNERVEELNYDLISS